MTTCALNELPRMNDEALGEGAGIVREFLDGAVAELAMRLPSWCRTGRRRGCVRLGAVALLRVFLTTAEDDGAEQEKKIQASHGEVGMGGRCGGSLVHAEKFEDALEVVVAVVFDLDFAFFGAVIDGDVRGKNITQAIF